MMEFFEFFFSGPNWGWKVFALILLVHAVGDIVTSTVNCFFDYRIEKYIADNFDDTDDNDTDDNNDKQSATKDDIRA